jgi:hypothetical protein
LRGCHHFVVLKKFKFCCWPFGRNTCQFPQRLSITLTEAKMNQQEICVSATELWTSHLKYHHPTPSHTYTHTHTHTHTHTRVLGTGVWDTPTPPPLVSEADILTVSPFFMINILNWSAMSDFFHLPSKYEF